MLQTAHLNELKTPLIRLLVFAVSTINLADNLKRIEKLIDGLGVEKLLPYLLVIVQALHPREVLDLLEKFLISRQLLK